MKNMNLDEVEFKGELRFLSNMFPCSVVIAGITYMSSENYYMSQKFVGVPGKELLVDSLRVCTPQKAKTLARKNIAHVREDWDDIKVKVMERALIAKFTQNTGVREKLLATGDKHLEERNCWNDTFWGTCEGKGQNMLGKLLMKVRDSISKD